MILERPWAVSTNGFGSVSWLVGSTAHRTRPLRSRVLTRHTPNMHKDVQRQRLP
jgi:hypothetical protein